MAPVAATFVSSEQAGSVVLAAAGAWLVGAAGELDGRLRGLALPKDRRVTLDLAGIDRLDTVGAWLLLRTEHDLNARGCAVELRNLRPDLAPLLDQVRAGGRLAPTVHQRPAHHTLTGFVARIGRFSIGLLVRTYSILAFFGLVCSSAAELVLHPRRIRAVATIAQIEQTGVNALGIVGLLSFLIGIVIAYQGADQLRRFGAEIYTVNLLGVSILRELGVLMTAIIIAGRSGSAFTAEIGTMRVNEEIDAMRTIGLDPVVVLVMPRLSGLLVTLPLLTLYADLMALLGGCLMCLTVLGITIPQFVRALQYSLYPWTFWIGIIKAPFFAAIIALIGCYEGFQVSRSAQSVGQMTTLAVVESIFLVIVTDAVFSVLFSLMGI
jgi:phospholipid/cholesterol/gamma-HCH transport system permease protein